MTRANNTAAHGTADNSVRAARGAMDSRLPHSMVLRAVSGDLMITERSIEEAILELVRTVQGRVARPEQSWTDQVLPAFAYRDTEEGVARRVHGGMPTLVISQLNWGAKPTEASTFGPVLAARRLNTVFQNTADLLINQMSGQYFEGICVALTGNLFDAGVAADVVRAPRLSAMHVESLSHALAESIRMLADQFSEVYVPCVTAMPADVNATDEERVAQSLDRLTYRMMKGHLADLIEDGRVTVDVSANGHASFQLYGTAFTLSNRAPESAVADRCILAGHVSSNAHHDNVFGGRSMRGAQPSQTLVMTHAKHGVTSVQHVSARAWNGDIETPLFRRMTQPADELCHLAAII